MSLCILKYHWVEEQRTHGMIRQSCPSVTPGAFSKVNVCDTSWCHQGWRWQSFRLNLVFTLVSTNLYISSLHSTEVNVCKANPLTLTCNTFSGGEHIMVLPRMEITILSNGLRFSTRIIIYPHNTVSIEEKFKKRSHN